MSEETIDFTDNSWKNVCARQYRHNSDNSPSISHPKDGFVIAYDEKETDLIVAYLQSTISQLQEANKELVEALETFCKYDGAPAYATPFVCFKGDIAEPLISKYGSE